LYENGETKMLGQINLAHTTSMISLGDNPPSILSIYASQTNKRIKYVKSSLDS